MRYDRPLSNSEATLNAVREINSGLSSVCFCRGIGGLGFLGVRLLRALARCQLCTRDLRAAVQDFGQEVSNPGSQYSC